MKSLGRDRLPHLPPVSDALSRGVAAAWPQGLDPTTIPVVNDTIEAMATSARGALEVSASAVRAGVGAVEVGSQVLERIGARAAHALPEPIARHLPIGRVSNATPVEALTFASVFGIDIPIVSRAELRMGYRVAPGELTLPLALGLSLRAEIAEGTGLAAALRLERRGSDLIIDRASAHLSSPMKVWDPLRSAIGSNAITRSPDPVAGVGVEGVVIDARRAVEVMTRTHAAGVQLPLGRFLQRVSDHLPQGLLGDVNASALSTTLIDELLARLHGASGEAGELELCAELDLRAVAPKFLVLDQAQLELVVPGAVEISVVEAGHRLKLDQLKGRLMRGAHALEVRAEGGVELDRDWNCERTLGHALEISGGGLRVIGKHLVFDGRDGTATGQVRVQLPPGLDALLSSVQYDARSTPAAPVAPLELDALATEFVSRLSARAEGILAPGDYVFPRGDAPPLWLRVFEGTRYTLDLRLGSRPAERTDTAEETPRALVLQDLTLDLSRPVELRNDPRDPPRPGVWAGLARRVASGVRHAVSAGVRRFELNAETGQLEARGTYRVGGLPLLDVRRFPQGLPLPKFELGLIEPGGRGAVGASRPGVGVDAVIGPRLSRLLGNIDLRFRLETRPLALEHGPAFFRTEAANIEGRGTARLEITRGHVDWILPEVSLSATRAHAPHAPGVRLRADLQLPADGREAHWFVRRGALEARGVSADFAASGTSAEDAQIGGSFRLHGPLATLARGGRFAYPPPSEET